MRKLKLSNTPDLLARLKKEINHSHDSRFLHRLHCVLLVAQDCSCYQIAEWFNENPRTIERWVHYAQEYGIDGLKDEQKTGRPAKVRDDQFNQVQKSIMLDPRELGISKTSGMVNYCVSILYVIMILS